MCALEACLSILLTDNAITAISPIFTANTWSVERTAWARGRSFWQTEVLNFRKAREAFNILCDQLCPCVNPQTVSMLDLDHAKRYLQVPSTGLPVMLHSMMLPTCLVFEAAVCSIFLDLCKALANISGVYRKRPITLPIPTLADSWYSEGAEGSPHNSYRGPARIHVGQAFGHLKGRW